MIPGIGRRVVTCAAAVAFGLVAAEICCRWLDGDAIVAVHLTARGAAAPRLAPAEPAGIARRYASRIPRAPAVQFTWYDDDPEAIHSTTLPAWAQARVARDPTEAALMEFNRGFLRDRLCRGLDAQRFGATEEFLYFDPPGRGIYPSYRLPPHVTTPGGLVTNAFGWRGPDITRARPPRTVRVGFVGSSTTVNDEGFPFSYPEFVGHWLNLWAAAERWDVRFEIVNAARSGINSHSIAAIVRDEVAGIDPDIVVYYEGANQFWPPDFLGYRLGRLYPRPALMGSTGDRRQDGVSALLARIRRLREAWRGGDGGEPAKPVQWLRLDSTVNESRPNPDDPQLPIELPAIIQDLDAIRETLTPTPATLVVSSFVWMVQDGLRLELPRQIGLFSFLNSYWPASYRNIRRLADLQNHVLAEYANRRGVPFVDIAAQYPQDPALFADAIHMRYPGVRLHAWIAFQALAGLLEPKIRAGVLPRTPSAALPGTLRPYFNEIEPKTISRREVLSECR